jgi:hypothetical protein
MISKNIFNPIWRWATAHTRDGHAEDSVLGSNGAKQVPRECFRHACEVTKCTCSLFIGVMGHTCKECGHSCGEHRASTTSWFYERECVVCLDALSVVRLPCQHLCLCSDCFEAIFARDSVDGRACPLCRGVVDFGDEI